MKKAVLLPLLLIGLLLPFTACSDSDNSNEANPLVGYWHIADNGRIVSLRIEENGTGEAAIYTYNGNEWNIDNLPLQYTIADGHITIKAGNDYTLSGKMAITGISLSITNNGHVAMFTEYDGDDNIIKGLQTHIENNFIEEEGNDNNESGDNNTPGENNTPGVDNKEPNEDNIDILPPNSTILQEEFWVSENGVTAMLASTYINSTEFIASQLNLENIKLTGKDLLGRTKSLTPTSAEVAECWGNAYRTINYCNNIIEHAPEEYRKYTDEAKALRCFIYYNIAHLWGQVPYITATNADVIKNSPIYRQDELYGIIYDEISLLLNDFENSRFGEYGIGASTLLALQAEIDLYFPTPSYEHTEKMLSQCHANFSLSVNEGQEDLYSIFGKEIALYTPQYIEFLIKETQVAENLDELWSETNNSLYGYWAMLKRRGLAYKHYMPIPEKELMFNPNLTQNPGY